MLSGKTTQGRPNSNFDQLKFEGTLENEKKDDQTVNSVDRSPNWGRLKFINAKQSKLSKPLEMQANHDLT